LTESKDKVGIRLPPPWNLKGRGYLFVYRFAGKLSETDVFCPEYFKAIPFSGLGAVMVVDYHESPVGSYRELLFIPGKFSLNGQSIRSITKIYVSSMASVENGRENWGIPKTYADFFIENLDRRTERIRVCVAGLSVVDMTLKSTSLVFPLTTAIYPLSMVHIYKEKKLFIKPKGRGWGRRAQILRSHVNRDFFPDFSTLKPLFGMKADRFSLCFPDPQIESC